MMGDALNYTLRSPIGIAGLITPWNLPLYLLSWKVSTPYWLLVESTPSWLLVESTPFLLLVVRRAHLPCRSVESTPSLLLVESTPSFS